MTKDEERESLLLKINGNRSKSRENCAVFMCLLYRVPYTPLLDAMTINAR